MKKPYLQNTIHHFEQYSMKMKFKLPISPNSTQPVPQNKGKANLYFAYVYQKGSLKHFPQKQQQFVKFRSQTNYQNEHYSNQSLTVLLFRSIF
ncbi:unnamed protein product [Paramecium octaurelia]|uniref:Uncharacterized protein n=1 Tax=Paramecium octaurelia TaxID=43137 RepID=A0A8S1SJI2_PAROT|nr:unnamed protein product [Paramecium octaurelia]